MKNVKSFNQFVNESMSSSDYSDREAYSNCCGAEVLHGDVCSACGEHCETGDDYENEEDYVEFPEDQTHDPEFEDDRMSADDHIAEGKKRSRKEVMDDAKEKYPNLKPGSMKKGLDKMKGKDFKAKAEKNFSWADNPEAAAAAYIRKATGKEPRDV